MSKSLLVLAAVAVSAGVFALGRWSATPGSSAEEAPAGAEAAAEAVWTCPMHSQVRLPEEGRCPLCGMELVLWTRSADDHPRRLVMSRAARELARITTAPVVRREVTRPVRLVGKVDYDETAVRTIAARFPGRIDRLFVDYTGVRVAEGDHLVELYSPELITAQEELLAARARIAATSGESSEFLASGNQSAYRASREKLLLWGLTEAQVSELEERGVAQDRVSIYSPRAGVVIEKHVDEGSYVREGTPIYRIAGLEHLWVRLDAYEQDVVWLRAGQPVSIQVDALPGAIFEGRISYIDPFINERSRTAKVRVNVDNADGRLKPGMFVDAAVSVRLGAGAVVLGRHLAGKWVSPMHPEVVEDGPGSCRVCGMDLVPAEDLGLVPDAPTDRLGPLVVPATAVLLTGSRAVAYVEVPGTEDPTYEGREVVVGPRAGDDYIVLDGLAEGERVVVAGAFRVDSSMQIRAKPGMMSVGPERVEAGGPFAAEFRRSLRPLIAGYLDAQIALAGDDAGAARAALATLPEIVRSVSGAGLDAGPRSTWSRERAVLEGALERAVQAADIGLQRSAFEEASASLARVVGEVGHAQPDALRLVHCPMAFSGRGANWLQSTGEVSNPYFGAAMLRCGEVRATFAPSGAPLGADARPAGTGEGAVDAIAPESPPDPVEGPGPVDLPLRATFEAYIELQEALAADSAGVARGALERLDVAARGALEELGDSAPARSHLEAVRAALEGLGGGTGESIADLRIRFDVVSAAMIGAERATGNPLARPLQVVHCPMAFDDRGADWIQAPGPVANPYFGASMLRCGAVRREIEGR